MIKNDSQTAKLTFVNGRPAICGCQVEYSSGRGEYSDVIYVTLCAKHSGSAIMDLVATNRIALTPEYEGQWHADLYLDREIPLAKAEGWPRSSALTGQRRAREGHTMRRALTAIALVTLVGLATVAAGAALQPFKTLFIWEVCR